MLQTQQDGIIPRHGPIMYAVRTVFRECRVFGRSHGFVKYSRTYLCCYFCFRTLTTHFHWVENCTSTVLIKVWPVIAVEVVCFMTLQIRSTYFDFFECTYGRPHQYSMVSLCINYTTCIYLFQQIKNHGRPVQNLMNKALLMSALYSTTQPSLLPRSAVVWSWTCWWKQKSSYQWNVLHCQDLKLLPLITKAKRPWHESDTAKTSHCIFSRIELDCATTSDKACWGHVTKILFFRSHPSKNGNRRQMNACPLPPLSNFV